MGNYDKAKEDLCKAKQIDPEFFLKSERNLLLSKFNSELV